MKNLKPKVADPKQSVKVCVITDFRRSYKSFLLPLFERLLLSSSRFKSTTRSSDNFLFPIFKGSLSAMMRGVFSKNCDGDAFINSYIQTLCLNRTDILTNYVALYFYI